MIYYVDHEPIDPNRSCLTLGCAGKFISFIELVFYTFIFFAIKDYFDGKFDKLLILSCVLLLFAIFSVSLFIGVINENRLFITPWLWLKYAIVTLQILRFVLVIIELAASSSDENPVGASPIFELLFLGYNVFALSIILELVEEIEPYTFKRFRYMRV